MKKWLERQESELQQQIKEQEEMELLEEEKARKLREAKKNQPPAFVVAVMNADAKDD